MPRGAPLTYFLRGLNKPELQAIPDRCGWCKIRKTDLPADELSKRVRKSIKSNVESGNIQYEDAMRDIRDKVLIPGSDPLANKIRYLLRSTPAATHIGDVRKEEDWFSAQLYGALWASIERPYTVKLERPLNTRNRPTVDLYIESEKNNGDYLIEVKRSSGAKNGEKVRQQVLKYHRAMQEDIDRKRSRTFVCVIGEDSELEDRSGSRKSQDLSEYLNDVPATVDKIGEDLPRTEVVSNTYQ